MKCMVSYIQWYHTVPHNGSRKLIRTGSSAGRPLACRPTRRYLSFGFFAVIFYISQPRQPHHYHQPIGHHAHCAGNPYTFSVTRVRPEDSGEIFS